MPKKIKGPKKSQEKKKPRVKLSQKVIQKVIVKIGEHKKAKKARRREKKQAKELESQPVQTAVPANVTYQTGYGLFQPPQQPQTISVPFTTNNQPPSSFEKAAQPRQSRESWQDVGVGREGIIEILEKPTKKETLENLGDVVSRDEFPPNANFVSSLVENRTENINSPLYTQQVLPQEQVQGNYRFGEYEEVMVQPKPRRSKLPEDVEITGSRPKKPNKSTIENIMLALDLNEEEAINYYYTERANGKNSLQINKEINTIIEEKIKQGQMSTTKEKGGIRIMRTPSRMEAFSNRVSQPEEQIQVNASSVKFK